MAHNLFETDNMLSTRITPWHGKGVVLATPPKNADEALTLSGLKWRVRREPFFLENGREVIIQGNSYNSANKKPKTRTKGHGVIIREDNDDMLGVVGPDYHILQNEEMLDIFDPFIQDGSVQVETCGSLFGGKVVWFLGALKNRQEIIDSNETGKDTVKSYMMMAHSHDQSLSVSYGFTNIRVVCYNTLSAALGKGNMIKIKHTRGMKDALKMITSSLDVASERFELDAQNFALLAKKGVTKASLREYAKRVLDIKSEDKITPHQQKVMDRIVTLATSGKGNSGRNYWHAYNGYTEYLTWEYGKSTDTRLKSLWFGDNVSANQFGFQVALEMAQGA